MITEINFPERDFLIMFLHERGIKYSELSRRFNLTPQRIAILYKRAKFISEAYNKIKNEISKYEK